MKRREREVREDMLNAFRTFNVDGLGVDEAVSLYAFGKTLGQTYSEFGLEAPEWVGEQLEVLSREIKDRQRDALIRDLKNAKAQREGLATVDEKRAKLDARIARLEAAIGG